MMESKITLEKMTSAHIDDLVEIENSCFSRPWSRSGFEAELDNDTAVFFAAVNNGKAVGYIGFHTVLDEGYIANIAVEPSLRQKGIGALLLSTAVEYCKENGIAFLSLEVRKSNSSAISLYQKFGFETVGERKRFYSEPVEDADIMTLNFGGQSV